MKPAICPICDGRGINKYEETCGGCGGRGWVEVRETDECPVIYAHVPDITEVEQKQHEQGSEGETEGSDQQED